MYINHIKYVNLVSVLVWKWEDLEFDLTAIHFSTNLNVLYMKNDNLFVVHVCEWTNGLIQPYTVVYHRRRKTISFEVREIIKFYHVSNCVVLKDRNEVLAALSKNNLLADMFSIDVC